MPIFPWPVVCDSARDVSHRLDAFAANQVDMSSSADRLWQKAQRYIADRQLTAARITLEALIQRDPQHVSAYIFLAGILLSEGRMRAATSLLLAAARAPQHDPEVTCNLALALLRVGEVLAAIRCADDLAAKLDVPGENLAVLAHVYQTVGDHPKALALVERARGLGMASPDFHYFRSIQLMFNGRIPEAQAELEACLKKNPQYGRAALSRARLGKQTRDSNHVADLRARLKHVEHGSMDEAALEFALFTELDNLREEDDAWSSLARGNAIMHERLGHDGAHETRMCEELIALTTPEFLAQTSEPCSGPMPIFVIGMPRSGTTVLEQILGNHSMVASAGELDDFAHQLRWQADCHERALLDEALLARAPDIDYANVGKRYLAQTQWRARGKRFFVDKLPPNYMLAGLIHRALPNAPIIHISRDPMDTCFSNYKALFGDSVTYSYSLADIAAHYLDYERFIQHWHRVMPGRILDVSYAELVRDPLAGARKVLEYCGLPFEPACIHISANAAPVATLSTMQVREPIHTRALGDWRRYEKYLGPLRDALGPR